MSKARDGANTLLTIGTTLAAKAPIASPVFTGNVGLGTSSPDERLHVMESSAGSVTAHTESVIVAERNGNCYFSAIGTTGAGLLMAKAGGNEIGRINYGFSDNSMQFYTNNAEKLRITSDGRGLSEYTAKAWVNLNGTGTPAIRDSHNISSITDNGTGDYICVYTVAMSNANYAAVANGGAVNNWRGTETTVITVSTANFRIYHVEDSSTYDTSFITGIVFGA